MAGMRIQTWQLVVGIVGASFMLVGLEIPATTWLTLGALSLACGVSALSLMASSAILGGRWAWVEGPFGGLDRVYEVHKWLGIYALALATVHLLFKADVRGWETAAILAMASDWARLARQASFAGLMLILLLALNRNIFYGVWRWWHRLSGPIFLIVVVHWLSIKSPIALASPAGFWLAGLSVLGVAAALWKLTLYPLLARHAEYRVVDVVNGGSAVQIDLLPTGRRIGFEPGQFGFILMKAQGLREPHPFTIATADSVDGRLRFVIRSLGDFTARLVATVQIGMRADVYAPHGRFTRKVGASREVWIAGGVGISPFIAWMSDAEAAGFERVTLFYFYSPDRVFPSAEVLRAMAEDRGVEFVPVSTGPATPDFIRRFTDIARGSDRSSLDIAVCGPKGLFDAVAGLVEANGLPPGGLRSERFAFR